MSTAIAKATMGGALISRDALKAGLGNITTTLPKVATGGIDFLNMDKAGEWTYGRDGTIVDEESVWAINPATLQHGWIAWGAELGNEPLGEIMVSALSRPLPDVATLPKVDEGKGYQQQYSVELLCVSGPDKGAHVLYKKESVGALKLFNVYVNELTDRVMADVEEIVAMVNITNESYMHKKYKKTFNPIFRYVAWQSPDDVSVPEPAAEEPEEEVVEQKAAPRRAAAKPAVEEPAVEQDEEEDEEDRLIREALERKEAKKRAAAEAAAAPAVEEEATPRRRTRR